MVDTIKQIVSQQGGQIDALVATMAALISHIDPQSPLANDICSRLERIYASKLQGELNQPYLDGYEGVMAYVKATLRR